MDDLKKQAEELGIKVDGRWSEDRLREEIGKAAPHDKAVAPHPQQFISMRVLRDFWGEDGRVRKGTIVDVPVETALDGVENGSLSRVKG